MGNLAPNPNVLHPIAAHDRVVFLKPLIRQPHIEVGEYTYYDHPDHATAFERDAVLYAFGPERLIIGKFCAIAAGVRFLLPGANHADRGPSTYPFGIFGGSWAPTMDLVLSAPSKRDTTIGHDVWLGYQAIVLPGVNIGHGAVVAAASVVTADVPPYTIVGGNPARVIRQRFTDDEIQLLLDAAWWDWPIDLVTEHARVIMSGRPADIGRIAAEQGFIRFGDNRNV